MIGWVSAFAIYFVMWWLVLFAMLPFGLRTQDDDNDVTLGTTSSAPRGPHMGRAMLRTTVVTTVIFGALYLIALCPLFWALFEQSGSSLNIFTDERVDRHLFGWEVPASWFLAINSFWIITLAPVFAALWVWLGKRGIEPNAPLKFALGMIQVGLGFIVLVYGAGRGDVLTPMIFIVLLYLLHSTAELCFSPVGLSSMTRLAVGSMTGLMMGTWFLATAAGNFLAAQIAKLTAGAGPDHILTVYSRIGWIVIGAGLAAIPLSWAVKRLMHLDTLGEADVGDDLLGQNEAGEPAAGGMHPQTRP